VWIGWCGVGVRKGKGKRVWTGRMGGPFTLRRRRGRKKDAFGSVKGFWGGWKGKSLVFRGENL